MKEEKKENLIQTVSFSVDGILLPTAVPTIVLSSSSVATLSLLVSPSSTFNPCDSAPFWETMELLINTTARMKLAAAKAIEV